MSSMASERNSGAQRFSDAVRAAIKSALKEPMDDRPNWVEMIGALHLHASFVEASAREQYEEEHGDVVD